MLEHGPTDASHARTTPYDIPPMRPYVEPEPVAPEPLSHRIRANLGELALTVAEIWHDIIDPHRRSKS